MAQYLIIQLARFGDLVQTKRLVCTLETRGQVHLCIDPGLAGIAALLYPKAILHLMPAHGRPEAHSVGRARATMADLAHISFNAVYNLNHAGTNRALARLFAPEQVYGYSMHGDQVLRSHWVRMAFRWTQQRPLAPVNLVDFWAYFDDAPCHPQKVNPFAQGHGRGLGVVLAGRESRRSLPPVLLAQITRTAFEALGGPKVYLLGSAGEKALARQLLRQIPSHMLDRVEDLSGRTDWQGLVNALTGLDTLITPDTGTMHLAAHLGVPVQAFFLSSAWCHETGPYGQGHHVWQSVHQCAPCLESSPCPIGTACLHDFEDRALHRALTALVRNPTGTLTELERNLPPGLNCQRSLVDALGSTWHTVGGSDPYATQRINLRALVAEHMGVSHPPMPPLTEHVDMLYEEADWMLAPTRNSLEI